MKNFKAKIIIRVLGKDIFLYRIYNSWIIRNINLLYDNIILLNGNIYLFYENIIFIKWLIWKLTYDNINYIIWKYTDIYRFKNIKILFTAWIYTIDMIIIDVQ